MKNSLKTALISEILDEDQVEDRFMSSNPGIARCNPPVPDTGQRPRAGLTPRRPSGVQETGQFLGWTDPARMTWHAGDQHSFIA